MAGQPAVEPFERDPVNKINIKPRDPVRVHDYIQARSKEQMVNMAEALLLRKQLKECYYREGVNHYQNCREIAQQYMTKINGHCFGSKFHKDGY